MNQAFCTFQNGVQNCFTGAHFPKHIHMNTSLRARRLISNLGLMNSTLYGKANKLFMTFPTGFSMIDDGNKLTLFVKRISIDARKSPNATRGCPSA